MIRLAPSLLLLACAGDDPDAPRCAGPLAGPGDVALAVSTLTQAFDAGTLTVVDLATGEVCDDVVTATGDSAVQVVDDRVVLVDRLGTDRLRWFEPGRWEAPLREVSLGDATNPHDLARCGEGWLVSLYERDHLVHLDDEGRIRARVDLSPWADADGLPEASTLVRRGDGVLVELQRLDRATDPAVWTPAGPGTVLHVSCPDLEVVDAWEVAENPRLVPGPGGSVAILGGDGSVRVRDPDGATRWTARLDHPASTAAFGGGGPGVVITRDAGLWHRITCIDAAGRTTPLRLTDAYLPAAEATDDGRVTVAVRTGWADPSTRPQDAGEVVLDPAPGLWRIDPAACRVIDTLPTALGPFDLAAY
jgi:hypothetical protein